MAASRRVIARQIARELLAGSPKDTVIHRLAAYLVSNKLESQSELVANDILRELAANGNVEAHITTAHPLTDELRRVVEGYVRQAEFAENVTLRETVDADIIGGIIIETPRKRLDASLTAQVKAIAKA